MTGINLILSLCFVFLQLTLVVTQISWEYCDTDSNTIQLLNLTVNPYPIVAPGSISVQITIRHSQDIGSPLRAELSLSRKVLFGYIHIPCVSGIGSCLYEDVCTLCPQCGFPLKAGDSTLTLPITIDATSWALVGNYQAQVDIKTNTGEKGCIKLNSIHIKSSR